MQNKGIVRFIAVALILVCCFYLSFSFVTRHYESKAEALRAELGDKAAEEYLDSISTEDHLWLWQWSLDECREMEVGLGLDLKGGMNVILEVSVPDIVDFLSGHKTDEGYRKAFEAAVKDEEKSQSDFISLFVERWKEFGGGRQLNTIFATQQMRDKVNTKSTDEEVIAALQAEVDAAIDNAETVVRTRVDKFGVAQPNIQKLSGQSRIMVEMPGAKKDKDRILKLLSGSADLQFHETYMREEAVPYLVQLHTAYQAEMSNVEAEAKDTTAVEAEVAEEAAENDTVNALEAAAKKDPNKAKLMRFLPKPLPAEKSFTDGEVMAQAANADIAVITIGRLSGEFQDRLVADFNLSDSERKLIEQVCDVYHRAGKQVVVLLNIGGVIETASWKHLPDAILCAWQPGQEGGNSVVDVLSGKISPSGKFTMTWPILFTDAYSARNFPIDEDPRIDMMKQGQKGNVRNVDFTDYEEDIYVGYRYFDSFGISVSFPFGFGLSYTTFDYSDAKIDKKGDGYEVSVTVKNSGQYEGKEVVELYISAPDNKTANKPVKELKAYAKTRNLKPGEKETVKLLVKTADLASFDEAASAWVVSGGEYQFLVGASSQDIKATLKADVKGQETKVHNVLKPEVQMNLLKR